MNREMAAKLNMLHFEIYQGKINLMVKPKFREFPQFEGTTLRFQVKYHKFINNELSFQSEKSIHNNFFQREICPYKYYEMPRLNISLNGDLQDETVKGSTCSLTGNNFIHLFDITSSNKEIMKAYNNLIFLEYVLEEFGVEKAIETSAKMNRQTFRRLDDLIIR